MYISPSFNIFLTFPCFVFLAPSCCIHCSSGCPPSLPLFSVFLLLFVPQPFLGSSDCVNQISGKIKLGKEVLATLEGHWVKV